MCLFPHCVFQSIIFEWNRAKKQQMIISLNLHPWHWCPAARPSWDSWKVPGLRFTLFIWVWIITDTLIGLVHNDLSSQRFSKSGRRPEKRKTSRIFFQSLSFRKISFISISWFLNVWGPAFLHISVSHNWSFLNKSWDTFHCASKQNTKYYQTSY